MNRIKQKIVKKVNELSDTLFKVSQFLLDNPEVAYQEFMAADHLSRVLTDFGFSVAKGIGGLQTSFKACPEKSQPGSPTLAFLAEYDALPKIGHGCGHNLIAAASLGAAIALHQIGEDIPGRTIVVGTPAEEGGGGKILLSKAGVFKDCDAAIMFHPSNINIPGKNSLGRIKFKIEFFGKSAHASGAPDKGINALDALINTYTAINSLRQHLKKDERIHGIITHGGDAPNIIPDYAAGLFYVRAMTQKNRDELFEKIEKCAKGTSIATGTKYKIEIEQPVIDPLKRNYALEEIIRENMTLLSIPIDEDNDRKGSSDIGNLSYVLPVAHPYLAIVDPDSVPGHSVGFCKATTTPRGRKTLLNATKMLAMTAFDYLSQSDLSKKVADEFNQ